MNLDGGTNLEIGEAWDVEDIEATRVYDAYLLSVQAGHPPDTEQLLSEHPTLATRLRTLIAANNWIASVAGDVIPEFEDYRIVRMLGRGGMGIVYVAEQISRGRHVAVKVLTSTAAMDPQQLKRFLQVEVPAAKLLRHPHIVPIIDVGCEQGVYFYAMQFIEGQNLAQLIKDVSESSGAETPVDGTAPVSGVGCKDGGASTPQSKSLQSSETTDPHDPFRKAARWGLQAAEAIEFAHRQGVVHRDIKPSNLLLDGRSNVWVTDFGLAHIQGEPHLTATGDLPGTPRYMSPEQIQASRVDVDHRTDIYSLGVTLYELLTLRPAFEGDSPQDVMRRVVEEEPKAPSRVNPGIPRDLETIVLKAMAKERDDRYKTAQDLSEDLRLFLARKPIQARRLSPLDRASRWARRHRSAVVTAAALLVGAVVGLSVGVILVVQARGRAVAAGALAEARARENRFESLMQRILHLRLTTHFSGWSADAWGLVREAVRLQPDGASSFQGEVAATLIGLDAHLVKRMETHASSLSFDPQGRQLWMGGLGEKLRVWDRTEDRIETMGPAMDGPFAFHADGTPLQLGRGKDAKTGLFSLQLWNAAKQSASVFEMPDAGATLRAYALSPDGAYVAAVVDPAAGERKLFIWETLSGRVLAKIVYQAVDLAFSPDAGLVVAWNGAGEVRLWTLPEAAPLATLKAGATPVRSIAFGRVPGRPAPTTTAVSWLLASGDAGGTVTLWDLGEQIPMNYCRGSQYDIYALAFSPDGTTLASAGRGYAKLWDVATGRLLLDMKPRNFMTSLAFSPDGTRLAVGSKAAFNGPGCVDVYELEDGRGIRTVRGLRAQVGKTVFSPDGRFIAGLSQDWRVAIWERSSGQLRLILEVPQGLVADNSGLAFSRDSRRFAFSAGRQAKLWEIEAGKELGAWSLPEGLQDTLAFCGVDQLMLLRMETQDGRTAPNSSTSPADHPRVMRLYDLLGARPTEPIREITDFNWHTHHTAATADGKYFVVEGLGGPKGEARSVNAYNAPTGARLWSYPSRKIRVAGSGFMFDPAGKVLGLNDDNHSRTVLLEMPTCAALGALDMTPNSLGPGARRWLGITEAETAEKYYLYSIYEQGRKSPVLQVAVNSPNAAILTPFSPDGRQVTWGNADGSVSVCDLYEVQRRLAEVGLGW